MQIIEENINQETITKYHKELFLFGETLEDLKNKKIIKLIHNGKLIAISMYSKLNAQEVDLYLNKKQEKYKDKLVNGLYIDSISALKHGYNVVKIITEYLKEKCKNLWIFSYIDAISFWESRKDWQSIGENIFVNFS